MVKNNFKIIGSQILGIRFYYHHFKLLSERLNIGKAPPKIFLIQSFFPKEIKIYKNMLNSLHGFFHILIEDE